MRQTEGAVRSLENWSIKLKWRVKKCNDKWDKKDGLEKSNEGMKRKNIDKTNIKINCHEFINNSETKENTTSIEFARK